MRAMSDTVKDMSILSYTNWYLGRLTVHILTNDIKVEDYVHGFEPRKSHMGGLLECVHNAWVPVMSKKGMWIAISNALKGLNVSWTYPALKLD